MNAAKPRYQQLKELIIERISSGELRPSDRVPSEHELVETTGVSRMTANRALRELNIEGYVERIAGRGTFVADFKAVSHPLEVKNIADEITERGHQHSAQVLCLQTVDADDNLAARLRVQVGAPVFYVRVVHLENELPIQLEDRYVLPEFFPEFMQQDFSQQTPSAYLTSIAPMQEAEQVLRAEMINAEICHALQVDEEEPFLVVTRRTWASARPVTFASLYHPGSRFELTGHFVPPGMEKTNGAPVAQRNETHEHK